MGRAKIYQHPKTLTVSIERGERYDGEYSAQIDREPSTTHAGAQFAVTFDITDIAGIQANNDLMNEHRTDGKSTPPMFNPNRLREMVKTVINSAYALQFRQMGIPDDLRVNIDLRGRGIKWETAEEREGITVTLEGEPFAPPVKATKAPTQRADESADDIADSIAF